MNTLRFMAKEGKEKLGLMVFALALMLFSSILFLVFSGQSGPAEILAGALTLVVLPVWALLLGASGFSAEFRSGAWAFLFSRPARKGQIWLAKYLSLLAIFLVILASFLLLTAVFPSVKNALKIAPFEYGVYARISVFSLGLLLAFLAFHIGFSLSGLSEKPFYVVFATILVFLGLGLLLFLYYNSLQILYPYVAGLNGIFYFMAASFLLASLLTFIKADFSQTKKKVAFFLKCVAMFLAVSLALSTALTWVSGSFIGPQKFIWNLQVHDGQNVYFTTNRGIFRYRSENDDVQKLGGKSWLVMPFSLCLGADKLAFIDYRGWRGFTEELWAMDSDGKGLKRLGGNRIKDSPFRDHHILSGLFPSADGAWIAFTSLLFEGKDRKDVRTLWWMNIEGSDIRSKRIESHLLPSEPVRLVSWGPGAREIILFQASSAAKRPSGKLIGFNLGTETFRILPENLRSIEAEHVSPSREFVIMVSSNEAEKQEILSVLDLGTGTQTDILKEKKVNLLKARWSPLGHEFFFVTDGLQSRPRLGIYSVSDQKISAIVDLPWLARPSAAPQIDWVYGGRKLALEEKSGAGIILRILSEDLKEEKRAPVPQYIGPTHYLFGANRRVVMDDGSHNALWRFDIDTDTWRRIY
jgi:hypothetical protein